MFLEISQKSQESTVSFLKNDAVALVFSCEFFTEHLRGTASVTYNISMYIEEIIFL